MNAGYLHGCHAVVEMTQLSPPTFLQGNLRRQFPPDMGMAHGLPIYRDSYTAFAKFSNLAMVSLDLACGDPYPRKHLIPKNCPQFFNVKLIFI